MTFLCSKCGSRHFLVLVNLFINNAAGKVSDIVICARCPQVYMWSGASWICVDESWL